MKILQFKEIGTNYSRILSVTLRLTKKCNFSCNYCMEYDNNFENISYELLKDFLINFIKLIKETSHYDKIFWYIHGGEPTMYPNFFNLLYQNYTKKAEFPLYFLTDISKIFANILNITD